MDLNNRPPLQPFGLERRWRLEGFALPAEPNFHNAITAQVQVHTAGDGLDLRQFGHRSIVCGFCLAAKVLLASAYLRSPGSRTRLASKLTIFHFPCALRT